MYWFIDWFRIYGLFAVSPVPQGCGDGWHSPKASDGSGTFSVLADFKDNHVFIYNSEILSSSNDGQ